MRPFSRLWQRIFVYAFLLIILSQGMAFMLHGMFFVGGVRGFIFSRMSFIADSLSEQPLEVARLLLSIYEKNGHGPRLELQPGDGTLPEEAPFAKAPLLEAMRMRPEGNWQQEGIRLWRVSQGDIIFMARKPITLKEGRFSLISAFGTPPGPPLPVLMLQSLIPMALVGGVLSFWMAKSVSRPLRRLHDEVLEIGSKPTGNPVSIMGRDEITDVALAVNSLMENVTRHVRGMRELIANISHELRSPLARANLAVAMIEDALPPEIAASGRNPEAARDTDEARERKARLAAKYMVALREELGHMDKLIGATLLSSKLDAQSPEELTTPVSLSELCLGLCRRYEALFVKRDLLFSQDVALELVVTGEKLLLTQLVSNLLDNAVKYTAEKGEVRLRLEKRRGSAFLTLENSCGTINDEELERVFEPFFRIAQPTGNGVGLGLFLVQKIAGLHGGEAMVVGTDVGVCFCVRIPLRAPRPLAPA